MNKLIYTPASMLDMFMMNDFETRNEITHNIAETNNDYVVELVAPGYKKDEFSISVENDYMIVGAKKEKAEENSDTKYHRKSYNSKSFTKRFILNGDVDLDNINANYENGILYINIPKAKAKVSKQIEIK